MDPAVASTAADTRDSEEMCSETSIGDDQGPGSSVLALILSNSLGCLFVLVAWAARELWWRNSGIMVSKSGVHEAGREDMSGQEAPTSGRKSHSQPTPLPATLRSQAPSPRSSRDTPHLLQQRHSYAAPDAAALGSCTQPQHPSCPASPRRSVHSEAVGPMSSLARLGGMVTGVTSRLLQRTESGHSRCSMRCSTPGSEVHQQAEARSRMPSIGSNPGMEQQQQQQQQPRNVGLDEVIGTGVNAINHGEIKSVGELQAAAFGPTGKVPFADVKGNEGRIQVLSVDDEQVNQQVMQSLLWDQNYELVQMPSGEAALEFIEKAPSLPDMVLLDVTLPGMSGFEVTRAMRELYSSCELPIIMVTCSSLEEDVILGLELGANDYMTKPLRYAELMARIRTQLALKRSVKVAMEATRNLGLLRSILPPNVIAQLKRGVTLIAQFHENVTILFSDIRGFTNLAAEWPTERIILMLNDMFTVFDQMCDTFGVYKVETIGDAYMIVSGHDGVQDHALRMAAMARGMIDAVSRMRAFDGRPLEIRIGLHTGPAHSGVVGVTRPRYCFFGDTVNTASRMESHGYPMCIHASEATNKAAQAVAADENYVPDKILLVPPFAAEDGLPPMQIPLGGLSSDWASCGEREVKGKGVMETWLLRYGAWEAALAGSLNDKEPEAAGSLLHILDQTKHMPSLPLPQLTQPQLECLQREQLELQQQQLLHRQKVEQHQRNLEYLQLLQQQHPHLQQQQQQQGRRASKSAPHTHITDHVVVGDGESDAGNLGDNRGARLEGSTEHTGRSSSPEGTLPWSMLPSPAQSPLLDNNSPVVTTTNTTTTSNSAPRGFGSLLLYSGASSSMEAVTLPGMQGIDILPPPGGVGVKRRDVSFASLTDEGSASPKPSYLAAAVEAGAPPSRVLRHVASSPSRSASPLLSAMSPGARLGGSSLTSTDEHAVVLSGRSSPVLNSVAQLQLSAAGGSASSVELQPQRQLSQTQLKGGKGEGLSVNDSSSSMLSPFLQLDSQAHTGTWQAGKGLEGPALSSHAIPRQHQPNQYECSRFGGNRRATSSDAEHLLAGGGLPSPGRTVNAVPNQPWQEESSPRLQEGAVGAKNPRQLTASVSRMNLKANILPQRRSGSDTLDAAPGADTVACPGQPTTPSAMTGRGSFSHSSSAQLAAPLCEQYSPNNNTDSNNMSYNINSGGGQLMSPAHSPREVQPQGALNMPASGVTPCEPNSQRTSSGSRLRSRPSQEMSRGHHLHSYGSQRSSNQLAVSNTRSSSGGMDGSSMDGGLAGHSNSMEFCFSPSGHESAALSTQHSGLAGTLDPAYPTCPAVVGRVGSPAASAAAHGFASSPTCLTDRAQQPASAQPQQRQQQYTLQAPPPLQQQQQQQHAQQLSNGRNIGIGSATTKRRSLQWSECLPAPFAYEGEVMSGAGVVVGGQMWQGSDEVPACFLPERNTAPPLVIGPSSDEVVSGGGEAGGQRADSHRANTPASAPQVGWGVGARGGVGAGGRGAYGAACGEAGQPGPPLGLTALRGSSACGVDESSSLFGAGQEYDCFCAELNHLADSMGCTHHPQQQQQQQQLLPQRTSADAAATASKVNSNNSNRHDSKNTNITDPEGTQSLPLPRILAGGEQHAYSQRGGPFLARLKDYNTAPSPAVGISGRHSAQLISAPQQPLRSGTSIAPGTPGSGTSPNAAVGNMASKATALGKESASGSSFSVPFQSFTRGASSSLAPSTSNLDRLEHRLLEMTKGLEQAENEEDEEVLHSVAQAPFKSFTSAATRKSSVELTLPRASATSFSVTQDRGRSGYQLGSTKDQGSAMQQQQQQQQQHLQRQHLHCPAGNASGSFSKLSSPPGSATAMGGGHHKFSSLPALNASWHNTSSEDASNRGSGAELAMKPPPPPPLSLGERVGLMEGPDLAWRDSGSSVGTGVSSPGGGLTAVRHPHLHPHNQHHSAGYAILPRTPSGGVQPSSAQHPFHRTLTETPTGPLSAETQVAPTQAARSQPWSVGGSTPSTGAAAAGPPRTSKTSTHLPSAEPASSQGSSRDSMVIAALRRASESIERTSLLASTAPSYHPSGNGSVSTSSGTNITTNRATNYPPFPLTATSPNTASPASTSGSYLLPPHTSCTSTQHALAGGSGVGSAGGVRQQPPSPHSLSQGTLALLSNSNPDSPSALPHSQVHRPPRRMVSQPPGLSQVAESDYCSELGTTSASVNAPSARASLDAAYVPATATLAAPSEALPLPQGRSSSSNSYCQQHVEHGAITASQGTWTAEQQQQQQQQGSGCSPLSAAPTDEVLLSQGGERVGGTGRSLSTGQVEASREGRGQGGSLDETVRASLGNPRGPSYDHAHPSLSQSTRTDDVTHTMSSQDVRTSPVVCGLPSSTLFADSPQDFEARFTKAPATTLSQSPALAQAGRLDSGRTSVMRSSAGDRSTGATRAPPTPAPLHPSFAHLGPDRRRPTGSKGSSFELDSRLSGQTPQQGEVRISGTRNSHSTSSTSNAITQPAMDSNGSNAVMPPAADSNRASEDQEGQYKSKSGRLSGFSLRQQWRSIVGRSSKELLGMGGKEWLSKERHNRERHSKEAKVVPPHPQSAPQLPSLTQQQQQCKGASDRGPEDGTKPGRLSSTIAVEIPEGLEMLHAEGKGPPSNESASSSLHASNAQQNKEGRSPTSPGAFFASLVGSSPRITTTSNTLGNPKPGGGGGSNRNSTSSNSGTLSKKLKSMFN